MIDVLIADDELPALDELEFLLRKDARIGEIHRVSSGTAAIQRLVATGVDAAFLDIHMPGLSGLDLARALGRFEHRFPIVFVTADEDRALEAFDVAAVDYLLKPVRTARLTEAVTRVIAALGAPSPAPPTAEHETIAVTVGDTTRLLRRDDVRYAQAHGDYTRLCTAAGSFLVRLPISELHEQWGQAGFLRIHRSHVVRLDAITQARLAGASPTVTVGTTELPVSRRLVPAVREALQRRQLRPSR